MKLPLHRLAAAGGGVGAFFVEGLAPFEVLLLLEEDMAEDAHGGAVADVVGDGEVVAVVDGEVRLEDAVEAGDAEELVVGALERLTEDEEGLVRRLGVAGGAERRRRRHVGALLVAQLGQPLAEPVGMDRVLVAVLAEGELRLDAR